ncbi:MAG: gliding motility-associated C-terminal domain-containing protein [Sphingobacteriales bacterium]|nr:gliding motility-associated C-terminal domain-containing protein [Sphingobacteriales bacterium]
MKHFYLALYLCLFIGFGNHLFAQSCVKLYGSIAVSNNEIKEVTVDTLSGNLGFLNSTTSPNTINLYNGDMTIDPDGQRLFVVLNTQLALSTNYSLRILTAQEGNPIANFPLTNRIVELQYDCTNDKLFGLQIQGAVPAATARLVEINTATGAITPIGGTLVNLNGFEGIVPGSSTINPNNNRYYFITQDDVFQTTIHDASTTTGTQTTTFVANGQLLTLEANKLNNRVFGLFNNNTGSTTNLVEYVSGTGVTDLGVLTGVSNAISQSALDPYGNRFFFITQIASNQTLHTVNTNTIGVTGNVALLQTIGNLISSVPCTALADFEFANTCLGTPVNFTDLSVGAEQWSWNFGEPASGAANSSTLVNPSHTYSTAGNFNVTLNIDGCVGTQSVTKQVTVAAAPTPTLPDSIVSCTPSVVLDPGNFAGATYFWLNGSSNQTLTVSNPNPIWYWVDITVGACTVRDSVFVNLSGGGGSSQIWTNANETFCGLNQATLNTNGITGSSYLWSTGDNTPTTTINASGTYSVTVTTANCTIIDQLNVTLVPPFNLASGTTVTGCSGSQPLDATVAGANYLWSTGATTPIINITQTGTYTVTVTKSGCQEVATTQVNIITLTATLNADAQGNLTFCSDQASINLQPDVTFTGGTGSASYQWSTGAVTPAISVSNGAGGQYTVTVSGSSCSTQASANVQFVPQLVVDLGPPQTVCGGNTVTLDAGLAGSTYIWSTGETTQQITVTQTDTYTVTVTNAGCTASDDVTITINAPLVVDFGITDSSICPQNGESILLDAGNAASYSWAPASETTQTITVTTAGTYAVTVTDALGCTASQSILVSILCESVLLFPNAFSPNNDTNNDTFRPIYQFISDYRLKVYNRWGELVFDTTDITEGWDGTTLKSKKQEIGVYVWYAEYTDNLGNHFKQQGNVSLLR